MHILGEVLEIEQKPEIDSLHIIWKEFLHLYQGVPIKGEVQETVGYNMFKVQLAQERDDMVTYEQLINLYQEVAMNLGRSTPTGQEILLQSC